MKFRKIALLFVFLLTLVFFGGCIGKSNSSKSGKTEAAEKAKCKEILEELLAECEGIQTDTNLFYGDEKYEEYFEYLYDTSFDRAQDGAYGYSSEAYADEVTVILANEEKDVKVIKGHLEDRISRRMKDFMGYKPEEFAKLENAVVYTEGLYVVMVVSDDPDAVIEKFKSIEK